MTNHLSRIIHTRVSSRQIPDLLQTIFVGEMIAPSSFLWIVSPWISDIPIINNTANSFQYLDSSWGRGLIRFSQVIKSLADLGTTIHVATRPDTHNLSFIDRLQEGIKKDKIHIHIVDNLHEKGIVGDSFYLGGSMNFTHNGITLNEEAVIYDTEQQIVAARRLIFKDHWTGEYS
jgi:hypothetical protein